jgi:hypothetical protein
VNALERAVIEAARAWHDSVQCRRAEGFFPPLAEALDALKEHEKAMAAGIREIDWSLVAVGDEVQGKSGTFYPVLRAVKVGDKYVIQIRMLNGDYTITRPSESQPMATVRRGQDGRAVDVFVDVLSSGNES